MNNIFNGWIYMAILASCWSGQAFNGVEYMEVNSPSVPRTSKQVTHTGHRFHINNDIGLVKVISNRGCERLGEPERSHVEWDDVHRNDLHTAFKTGR